jgi:thermolysin metallopeptidase-like protein
MEIAAKILLYLTLGIALLACNVWYVRAVWQSIAGGGVVVAPVKVVGATGDASLAGEALARLIISRLQTLEWELQQSQSSLRQAEQPAESSAKTGPDAQVVQDDTVASPRGVTTGILGTPKIAVVNAQLFEPTNIDVKVAGVDVGGLLPSLQRWFVNDRTLTFSVLWEGNSAIVAGNIDALGLGKTKPLSMLIQNPTMNSIADAVALALIHRQWSKDSSEFGELEDDEFNKLVASINEIAKVNRRVITYHIAAKADFERILTTVSPVAERISGWSELTYFAASIAESAENYGSALTFYRRMKDLKKPPLSAELLAAKIAMLETLRTRATGDNLQSARQKFQQALVDATRILNGLFKLNLENPRLEIISDDVRNAYWDGEKINIPPSAQDIPDILYHEVTIPFISKRWSFKWNGEEGALVTSYTDVLTSLIKQKMLNQAAKEGDWVIAPGAIAWITGHKEAIGRDNRPLRSLKAPGTAYDDPIAGKDAQPDHISKLVVSPNTREGDFGGIHTNSGIPNRAFYETAMRIGTEEAGNIWISSLSNFKPNVTLRVGARVIYNTAVKLHGENSTEAKAVKAGWNAVGLLL